MKHYIKNNEILAFEVDGSQDHLITSDMKEISLDEVHAINKAKEEEYKATVEYKIQEAKQYLTATDWYITRKFERGIEIPEEVQAKRAEAVKTLN